MGKKYMNEAEYKQIRDKNILTTSKLTWQEGKLAIPIPTLNRINAVKFLSEKHPFRLYNKQSKTFEDIGYCNINNIAGMQLCINPDSGPDLIQLFRKELFSNKSPISDAFIEYNTENGPLIKLLSNNDNVIENNRKYEEINNFNSNEDVRRISPFIHEEQADKEFILTDYAILGCYMLMYITLRLLEKDIESAKIWFNQINDDECESCTKLISRLSPPFIWISNIESWYDLLSEDLRYIWRLLGTHNSISVELKPKVCSMDYCGLLYYGTKDRKFCAAHHRNEILAYQKREERQNKK